MANDFTLETLESSGERFESVEENEWSKLIKSRFKEGFVEGKYMGGESTVQSGFDRGYEKGFEASYPISILKGLLAANEILQKDSNPDSLRRSEEIKQLLNEFEKKTMGFMKKRDENRLSNCLNDNQDAASEENLNEGSSREGNFEISYELSELKREVLIFLKDCNQPQVIDQITYHFEKWGLFLSKNFLSNPNHSTSTVPCVPEQS